MQDAASGSYATDFSLPGAESQKAFDLLENRFPNVAGDTADFVFKADQGVTDPEVEAAMKGLFDDIMKVDRVVAIDSPYSQRAQGRISGDGTIAFATDHFSSIKDEPVPHEIGTEIVNLADDVELQGLTKQCLGCLRNVLSPMFPVRAQSY